ncbi:latrophilin Cirl-like [Clytia hemisphaerica]|uniref:G-protein coupled receptors family 2 profile 2 domain-containing protein n=1 Tax=Clytia hemisphaerica TaxID=252671 RepID=A0A7M5WYY5_9CNID
MFIALTGLLTLVVCIAHAQNNTTVALNTTSATYINNNSNNFTTTPYATTTNNATTTTTTTTPQTTSTLSPQQKYHQQCLDYEDWLPTKAWLCDNPFDFCYHDVMDTINTYLTCKTYLNETQPSKLVRNTDPMIVASYLYRMGRNMINSFEHIKLVNPFLASRDSARRTMQVLSNVIYSVGLQYRYGDYKWPDYKDAQFQRIRPKGKWNKRNDSITVPYGSFPKRHEYQYHFFAYDNLANIQITDKEQVRLMDDWPDHHSIWKGTYIDYMAEPGLYYIENLEINTALLQIDIKPDVAIPLPGEIVIAFNHKRKNMKNPICVYWQYIKPDDPDEVPSAGYWSNYGMAYRNGNSTMTVCKAYHHGIYAVLMEKIIEEPEEFDIWGLIMMLGMVVAILLSGAFIAFMFMFRMQLDIYCRLFIYTAFAVILFQITFLYSYLIRKNWSKCTSITSFLEVFQVQIVTWVLVQNIHQLSRLRLFFNSKTNVDALYLILGWCIPIAVLIALQGFPHHHYGELRYCWLDFSGMEWLYYAGPLVVIALSTFCGMFLITQEMQKSPDKADKDINFIRAGKGIKSGTAVLLTVGASWVIGTYGLRTDGWTQIILMLAQPFINIVLSWEMWSYYFSDNDAVADALEENRRIKERIRFLRFKHLEGIKMKVKYEAKEGDMETNLDEIMALDEEERDDSFGDDFEDQDLDDLIDFDVDEPDFKAR